MGRETGSVNKVSRRLGFSILENEKEFSKGKKRTYGPGMHGSPSVVRYRRRVSAYGKQLIEKQKLRHLYQISEKQLKNLYIRMEKKPGITSLQILVALEKRLDNVVFRLMFATTRRHSRQLVNHGHVLVNGKKVDIPSYEISINDVITLSDKAKDFKSVEEVAEISRSIPEYMQKTENVSGKMVREPNRDELNPEINETLIVEYYNKLL